ncbi:MAG: hypothetical protein NT171_07230 [Planctomycetota bacterium]|nr:hypothetical protein [Planctomycetota bacterium]
MTMPTHETAAPRRMSLAQKIALASGAGAAITGIALPQSAEATPIQSTTVPLTPTVGDYTYWDIDGNGTDDFGMYAYSSQSSAYFSQDPFVGGQPGNLSGRFVFPQNGVPNPAENTIAMTKLSVGVTIGSNLGTANRFISGTLGFGMVTQTAISPEAAASGWALGDIGYFGFKFTNTSGVHYGWAQIDIHGQTGGYALSESFTITNAYYESTPGASINVGDTGASAVPEIDPASAGSVMSLVIGSLAMLERRRKLRAADASPTAVSA